MSYLNWTLNPDAKKSPAGTGAIDNPKAPPAKHFKVDVLAPELSEPVAFIVLPNERILIAERTGALKEYDPARKQTTLAATLPVESWDGKIAVEHGLLGIAADPEFAANHLLYCYYSVQPAGADATRSVNRLSRFRYQDSKLALDSERVILEVPTRLADTGHEAGALAFGPDGLLYLSTGDNASPHGPDAAPMDPKKRSGDARRSAGNTNDLRGKILRIRIKPDGSYTIPPGNLFAPGMAKTRPEIYVLGVRNPYTISINRKTGTLYWAEVGPDKNPTAEEINQAKTPGFYGWPFFISDNLRFITPDDELTDPLKVVNNSPFNTGLTTIPLKPRKPLHQYNRSCSILGEVYHHQDGIGEYAFPTHFDNCLFYGDWNRSFIEFIRLDATENKVALEALPINFKFRKIIDLRFHKGELYVLEYGDGWLGAKGGRLSKISYSPTFNQVYDASADQRIAGMAQNHPGTQLVLTSTCLSCHSAQNKLVGPSFVELAARYQADEPTLKTLAAKVRNGGAGAWGAIPMPAHPQYGEGDVTKMLQAILGTEDLAAGHKQSISLFNGKDLSGWHKVGGTGQFTVENGVIRGHGIDIEGNTFLTTDETYDNFELELEARFDMDELTNSGVQFRSHLVDNRLRGYQFEFDNGAATSYTGAVWDEYGTRGFIAPFIPLTWIHTTDYDALMQKHGEAVKAFQTNTAKRLKKRDWNRIKIRCQDGQVQTWLNGVKQAEFTDPAGVGYRSGVIGLQLHSGKRCEVSWRNITLTPLGGTVTPENLRREVLADFSGAAGYTTRLGGEITVLNPPGSKTSFLPFHPAGKGAGGDKGFLEFAWRFPADPKAAFASMRFGLRGPFNARETALDLTRCEFIEFKVKGRAALIEYPTKASADVHVMRLELYDTAMAYSSMVHRYLQVKPGPDWTTLRIPADVSNPAAGWIQGKQPFPSNRAKELRFVIDRSLGATAGSIKLDDLALWQKPLEFPVVSDPKPLTPLMEREFRGCFDFFWNEWVKDPNSPTYGLTNGDYVGMGWYSPIPIESQGFYLAAIVIGVERGWITREAGAERAVLALKSIKKLKQIRGHYYHFIDPDTGKRGWNDSHDVELTNAATGTMAMGALAAGEYFGGDVKSLANEIYARIDWKWFTNPKTHHPYLACYPEDRPSKIPPGGMNEDGFFGAWAAYSEHLFLYVLAAGAPDPAHATGAEPYYAMKTFKSRYKGKEFIMCGSGAAFTYQWTHAFIDFRNMRDKHERNWFENSRHAAIAARQYAIDNAHRIKGLGPNSWGMSACMSPSTGYSGAYGAHPITPDHKLLEDGTVAPYGSSAFVVFTPSESIAALGHMYQIPGLVGKYGLYDAYSYATKAEGDQPWIGKSYLGIDKGLVLLMFENYSTQLIWRLLHQSPHIQKGLKVLEFRHRP